MLAGQVSLCTQGTMAPSLTGAVQPLCAWLTLCRSDAWHQTELSHVPRSHVSLGNGDQGFALCPAMQTHAPSCPAQVLHRPCCTDKGRRTGQGPREGGAGARVRDHGSGQGWWHCMCSGPAPWNSQLHLDLMCQAGRCVGGRGTPSSENQPHRQKEKRRK